MIVFGTINHIAAPDLCDTLQKQLPRSDQDDKQTNTVPLTTGCSVLLIGCGPTWWVSSLRYLLVPAFGETESSTDI